MLSSRQSRWLYGLGLGAILIVGIVLRFYDLGNKPLHHDESLHAWISWRLFKYGTYRYNPIFHGPLLYYQINLAFQWFGPSDTSARIAPALAGCALLAILPAFRPQLGRIGVAWTGFVVATSPMLVYVSRFARHDMASLLCTALVILGTIRFAQERKVGDLYVVIGALTISYINHELTYITLAIWLLSVAGACLLGRSGIGTALRALRATGPHLAIALTAGFVVTMIFYSSFYRNPAGFVAALPNPFDQANALGYWAAQHGVRRGGQPPYYYFFTLSLYEVVPFGLGIVGAWRGFQHSDGARRFVSLFAFGSLAAYSIAGERMPWLTIHPLLPLILCSAFIVSDFLRTGSRVHKISLALPAMVALAFTAFNAFRLSFLLPASPREMAVYVQSQPSVVATAERLRREHPHRTVYIDNQLDWPFAWYLREASRIPSSQRASAQISVVAAPTLRARTTLNPGAKRLSFRQWWTPPSGWPGARALLSYYLYREIWGEEGSFDYFVIEDKKIGLSE